MHPAFERFQFKPKHQPSTTGETNNSDNEDVLHVSVEMLWFSHQRDQSKQMKEKIWQALKLYDFSFRNPLTMTTKNIIIHMWALVLYYNQTKEERYLLQAAYFANYVATTDHEDLTDSYRVSYQNSRRLAADSLVSLFRISFRNLAYQRFNHQVQENRLMSMHKLWKLVIKLNQQPWLDKTPSITKQQIESNLALFVAEALELKIDVTAP